MSNARHKAREAAVQALYQWLMTDQNVQDIDDQFEADHDMSGVEVEYFRDILFGVPKHLHELEDHLIPHLDRSIKSIDPVERTILRIGAYELQFKLEVPYRVVINEGVELAKTFGAEDGHKYVNSILDNSAKKLRSTEIKAKKQTKQA